MKAAFVAILAALIAGCASMPQGVQMTAEEGAACAAQGCSVWTLRELQELARKAFRDGYAVGVQSL